MGMPGSGKSFFQKKIINQFKNKNIQKNNYKILNKINKLFYFFLFFLSNQYFFIKTLFIIIFKLKKVEKSRNFYYFHNEIALRSFFQNCNYKTNIFNDEGFLYRSAAYFDRKYKTRELENYLDKLPKIDLIIYLYSKKEINIKRTLKRTNGYKYKKYDFKNYNKKEELLKKIISIYKKKNVVKFISIRNEKNKTKKNIRLLSKKIKII